MRKSIPFVILFVSILLIIYTTQGHPEKIIFTRLPTPRIFKHGNRAVKRIAFTFDADMTPFMKNEYETGKVSSWYNQAVIQTLEQTHTPATLFLTGMWAQLYPDVTKKLAANPLFEIGNHSYSHPSFGGRCYGLSQLPISQYNTEIEKTQQILASMTSNVPTLFRFPGGCYNDFSLQTAINDSLTVVGWDVVSDDSFNKNVASIEKNILDNAKNGSIIVMHMHGGPNAPETATALADVIPILEKRGFHFVKVSDLLPHPISQIKQNPNLL